MRDIGKNIRDLRSKRNMTQDELAEKLFVTRQTVSNYETGRSRPDLDMLVKISEVLECDTNAILFGTAEGQQQERDKLRFWIGAAVFAVLQGLILWLGPIAREQMVDQFKPGMVWLMASLLTVPKWITVGWLIAQMFRGWFKVQVPQYPWAMIARRSLLAFLAFTILYTAIPGVDACFGTAICRMEGWSAVNRVLLPLQYWVLVYVRTFVVPGVLLNLLGFPKMRDKSGEDVVS